MKTIKIEKFNIEISNNKDLILIAGPCVLENEEISIYIAKKCKELCKKYKIGYIFKGSFDKANRTSVDSFRGVGINEGKKILEKIKLLDIPVTTDVHSVEDISKIADILDIIQIPAFLSRQTDILVEAAKTGKIVNVKKGQFLAPNDVVNIIKKIEKYNNYNILLTERGSCFGYNNLVVDMKGIAKMKKFLYPIIYDATHSMQLPGNDGNITGGEREFALDVAKSSVAIGIAGIFMEVHPEPEKSLSDKTTIYPLDKLEKFLQVLKNIDNIVKKDIVHSN